MKEHKINESIVAQKGPYAIEVKEGKTYYWCQCGRSNKQPFCDGSHKGTNFNPIPYKAKENKKVFFCGCKKTSNQTFCEGTHNKLHMINK